MPACPWCGYDRTHQAFDEACPECGEAPAGVFEDDAPFDLRYAGMMLSAARMMVYMPLICVVLTPCVLGALFTGAGINGGTWVAVAIIGPAVLSSMLATLAFIVVADLFVRRLTVWLGFTALLVAAAIIIAAVRNAISAPTADLVIIIIPSFLLLAPTAQIWRLAHRFHFESWRHWSGIALLIGAAGSVIILASAAYGLIALQRTQIGSLTTVVTVGLSLNFIGVWLSMLMVSRHLNPLSELARELGFADTAADEIGPGFD